MEDNDNEYNQNIIELFKVMSNAMSKVGLTPLMQCILRFTENNGHPLKKELENEILKIVSLEFNVNVDDILNSNKRRDVILAKKITFVLFKNELALSEYKIAKYFNRNRAIINRAIHEFQKLDNTLKTDKIILDSYNNIASKISEFKKEINYDSIIKK